MEADSFLIFFEFVSVFHDRRISPSKPFLGGFLQFNEQNLKSTGHFLRESKGQMDEDLGGPSEIRMI